MNGSSQVIPIPATEIKKALIDRNMSVAGLARRLRKSRSAVSLAIHHPTILPDVRRAILRKLHLQ